MTSKRPVEEYTLPGPFSAELVESLKQLGTTVKKSDTKGREDLTKFLTFHYRP